MAKKFYVTNNYKTRTDTRCLGTTHVQCASLFFPQKCGQKCVHCTWQTMGTSTIQNLGTTQVSINNRTYK